jgi:hypothetical protein
MASSGSASFDDVRVKTSDRAFAGAGGSNMLADTVTLTGGTSEIELSQSQLDAAAVSAMEYWTTTLGDGDPRLAGLGNFHIATADLAGNALGYAEHRSVLIDQDAAGQGWALTSEGLSAGRMDLLTVVTHEVGHMLGLDDNAAGFSVMNGDLETGVSYLLDAVGFDANPDLPISDQMLRELAARAAQLDTGLAPGFDLGNGRGAGSAIDWNAGSGEGWGSSYSPYAADKGGKDARGNFSDYLVKLFRKGGDSAPVAQGGGYDSLGSSLFGTKPGKGKSPR